MMISTRLGSILRRYEEPVTLVADQFYKQLTVRLHGKGVVLRGELLGSQIGSERAFTVRGSQFILSRIDARNGALGLVPDSLDGSIVSRDFPSYEVDKGRVLASYLEWMSKTNWFVALCQQASEGTTNRVRLQEHKFLDAEIPLPSLAEQQRIVARIEALAGKIEAARRLRGEAAEEVEHLLISSSYHLFASLQDCRELRLEDVCTTMIDCPHSNPRYIDSPEGIPTLRGNDIGWGQINLAGARKTDEVEYRRRTARGEPQIGDIVFVREGTVGKAGLVVSSQRFSLGQRVMLLRANRGIILPEYLLYQLLSPLVYIDQIQDALKGTTSRHLNIKLLKHFRLLVPDLKMQEQVVSHLRQIRSLLGKVQEQQKASQRELDALLPAVLDRAFRGEL